MPADTALTGFHVHDYISLTKLPTAVYLYSILKVLRAQRILISPSQHKEELEFHPVSKPINRRDQSAIKPTNRRVLGKKSMSQQLLLIFWNKRFA